MHPDTHFYRFGSNPHTFSDSFSKSGTKIQTINELIEAYEMYYKNNYSIRRFDGSEVPRYVFNGHQAKAPNGNILSFSEDMQYLTIYDSENPKYYFAIKMNFENLDYEVTDKIISADFYIKNSSNMIRVSEEYMDL